MLRRCVAPASSGRLRPRPAGARPSSASSEALSERFQITSGATARSRQRRSVMPPARKTPFGPCWSPCCRQGLNLDITGLGLSLPLLASACRCSLAPHTCATRVSTKSRSKKQKQKISCTLKVFLPPSFLAERL
eukprot:SAG11_NODE_4045_length_2088_cov_2.278029_2_plen_134_part_00